MSGNWMFDGEGIEFGDIQRMALLSQQQKILKELKELKDLRHSPGASVPKSEGPPCPKCYRSLPPEAVIKKHQVCVNCLCVLVWKGSEPLSAEAVLQEDSQRKARAASAQLGGELGGTAKDTKEIIIQKLIAFIKASGEVKKAGVIVKREVEVQPETMVTAVWSTNFNMFDRWQEYLHRCIASEWNVRLTKQELIWGELPPSAENVSSVSDLAASILKKRRATQ